MKIDILGEKWIIVERNAEKDINLLNCDGYCDWTIKTIVIRRERDGNLSDMERYIKKVKRHEIIHAFFLESGLAESSLAIDAWAQNEEMIDWMARNIEKIYKCCIQAEAV